ncbi:MAG: hypothetical protein AAFX05_09290, partial [Planctomycetota bacterium]
MRTGGVAPLALLACAVTSGAGDFADLLFEYTPSPGQFVNEPSPFTAQVFNDPMAALGPPIGGGTLAADNTKLVTLGGFGGAVAGSSASTYGGALIVGFSQTVLDDPCNPYGLDAIVFGNAIWVGGDPNRRFAEAGVIEISRDANGNGLPDDAWYVVRGSSIPAVPSASIESQDWDDDPVTPTPPDAATVVLWYPSQTNYPGFPDAYTTMGPRLPSVFETSVVENPNGLSAQDEALWGYADFTPTLVLGDTDADNVADDPGATPETFYTVADNPFEVGITP